MKFYKHRLLSDAQLRKLSEHKYSCTSNSICDALLQGWWNWLVSKVPLWLAPNLITIVGLFVNVVTTLILVWYSPDAKQEPPGWACALCALGLFVYQSLDAIDGKQARRTGSANPLGELFDHGCDSISTVFVALSACTAVQLGYYPGWMFFQCFCAMTLFYCAHWQTYVSGTLRFGQVDVTEAQYTIITLQLISAIFGPGVWTTKFFGDSFPLWYLIPILTCVCGMWSLSNMLVVIFTGGIGKNGSTVAVLGFPLNHFVCWILSAGYIKNFIVFLGAIKAGGCGKNGSTVAIAGVDMDIRQIPMVIACLMAIYLAQANIAVIFTGGVGKNGSTVAGTSVLSPIIPFSAVLLPAFIIYRKSVEHVYEEHPALYILAFGMVAAKVTNRLVVAHMTKSEMEYMDWSLLGPAMLFLNQYFNTFIPEHYVLWLCLVWVTFDLYRYCYQICHEICDHLHIELFRIPYLAGPQRPHAARVLQPQATAVTTEKNGMSTKSKKSRNKYH